MRKSETYIYLPGGTASNRTSLGLRTRRPFELQILEIALGGRKVLEKYWKEEGEKFDICEQVVVLEILKELEQLEKDGSFDMLIDRARNQVVIMKGNKSLHQRALFVYRHYLTLSISSEDLDYGMQILREESTEFTIENRERESKTYSRSSQVLTIDDRLDLMMGIELPEMQEEDLSVQLEYDSKAQQGEPSDSSCEVICPFDDTMSCETLSIFERPVETEGFISRGSFIDTDIVREKTLSEMWRLAEKAEERDPVITERDSFVVPMLPEKCMPWNDDVDVKIEVDEETPRACGIFPEKDFKTPVEWKLDKSTFKVTNLSDLRRNHNILIEGPFRKRGGRCHIWRDYYGFFLTTGVMLYFRKKDFKKAVDFRKSTPFIPKNKQFKLNIRGLYVDSKPSDWVLKFANEKKLNTWYDTILKFSQSQGNRGLEQLLGPPVELN